MCFSSNTSIVESPPLRSVSKLVPSSIVQAPSGHYTYHYLLFRRGLCNCEKFMFLSIRHQNFLEQNLRRNSYLDLAKDAFSGASGVSCVLYLI